MLLAEVTWAGTYSRGEFAFHWLKRWWCNVLFWFHCLGGLVFQKLFNSWAWPLGLLVRSSVGLGQRFGSREVIISSGTLHSPGHPDTSIDSPSSWHSWVSYYFSCREMTLLVYCPDPETCLVAGTAIITSSLGMYAQAAMNYLNTSPKKESGL